MIAITSALIGGVFMRLRKCRGCVYKYDPIAVTFLKFKTNEVRFVEVRFQFL